MYLLKDKRAALKFSFLILGLIAIVAIIVYAGGVFANTHNAIVTISPNVTNCSELGKTFIVNIQNENFTEADSIFEVRIYEGVSLSDFHCGDAPSGWTLYDFVSTWGYCEYKTAWDGSSVIDPGENLDFTFDATMVEQECYSEFLISTLDNERPEGEHEYNSPRVYIDCTPPETDKYFDGPQKKENDVEWINGITEVVLDPSDDTTCEYNSGVAGTWYKNILAEDLMEQFNLTCDQSPCENQTLCNNLLQYANDVGVDEPYDVPFTKEEESCHILYYYSEDELGNEEDVKVNCFYVDKTAPEIYKEVGEPKIDRSTIEQGGDGVAAWTTSQFSTGASSARLRIPETPAVDDFAGVDSFFDVFVELDDITSLSYDRKVTEIGNKAWIPLIVLGIDSDGDGGFEAQPLEWEAGSFNPSLLGDDSFIQCEHPTGELLSTDGSFVNVDAYNDFKCYTPNSAGDGWEAYQPLSYFQSNNVGRIETTDEIAMVKVMLNVPAADGETVYVDNVELNGNVIIDEDLGFTWVTQSTPIDLWCTDVDPHPSNDVTIHWRTRVDEGQGFGTWTEDSQKTDHVTIYFQENSVHELEYWCVDAVEKESDHFFEIDKVDNEPPIIMKEMFGSYLGDCPEGTYIDHGDCYVADDGLSGVEIWVEDPNPIHAVDQVSCYYELWWEEQMISSAREWNNIQINFTVDSTHILKIWCEDALGNEVYHEETFLVDSTPPETTKTYEGPHYPDPIVEGQYPHWITSDTLINITAKDVKVGVNKTYSRVTLLNDNKYCESYASGECIKAVGSGDFVEYQSPFLIQNESCHLIEFYSVDLLGNEENTKRQCVYVDNTPPEPIKTITGPQINGTGEVHKYLTNESTIRIECIDQLPHPVGGEILEWEMYWKYDNCELDADWGVAIDSGQESEGYKEFTDLKESCHKFVYWCSDILGNVEPAPHDEIDIVDNKAPEITKTIVGPKWGVCPPTPGSNDICYIDGITNITVDVVDPDPHPVGGITCSYEYVVSPTGGGDVVNDLGDSFIIQFPEESEHILTITCRDALRNEVIDIETFYVDKTPPTIEKEYEGPQYPNLILPETEYPHYINSETNITISVDDSLGEHDSGVNKTKYRYDVVDDRYCNGTLICEDASTIVDWITLNDPTHGEFSIPDDSCHLIEIYAEDNVEKSSTHKQCVFVDNQPPTPLKEVGVPKTVWDGQDSDFYPWIADKCWNGQEDEIDCWKVTLDTPISMTCTDPEPHPVDNEKICFNVELDGDDWTEDYCTQYGGDYNETGDGYCCLDYTIENFKFLESSEHNLKFYCEDALGNSNKENIDEEKFKVEGNDFEIQLNKKWNLISVPVVLLNDDPAEIFENMSCVDTIWTYDGKLDEWSVFTPGDAPDNLKIKPGFGYWIMAKEDCNLTIGGSLLSPGRTPPSRNLVPGWNLIGYYGLDNQSGYYGPAENGDEAYCSLYSLVNTNSFIPVKRWSSLYGYWDLNNPQFEGYGMCDNLDPGAGYWIHMPADMEQYTYAPSTGCPTAFWDLICGIAP